jgi:hypothetical protein
VGCFVAVVLLRGGDLVEVVVGVQCRVMGLLWFWFGWGWWIILDSNLVLEKFAEDVKWCDWC